MHEATADEPSMSSSAEQTIQAVRTYCQQHQDKMPYHAGRLMAHADAEHLNSEQRLRKIRLYIETQGDKFHPFSDELGALTQD